MTGNERYKRLMQRERTRRGNRCKHCGETLRIRGRYVNLQFAHVKETGLHGQGRGRNKRINDIIKHNDAYELLCPDCHYTLDCP